jgi:hypothetical protein
MALIFISAYFSDRIGDVDEIGLFNPTYMDLHYGKITYPIHGYFDSMVVHPPVHYKMIAAFMRRGFTYYYAQATPALLMLLLGVLLVVGGPFPAPVKMGLLLGLVAPIAANTTLHIELFGMRPENHLNAAWLAGLIALESARLENWSLKKLALGAFLLTYASGLHYYAAEAFLGVGVYLVWALVQLGWLRARKPLMAILAGGLLFGVPYLLLFFIPQWRGIGQQLSLVPHESMAPVLQDHLTQYRVWSGRSLSGPWLGIPFSRGIPLILLSTPILLALRSTRGLALAALPLQLFVLLFAAHKHAYYFVHEISIYGVAAVAGTLSLAVRLLRMLPRQQLQLIMERIVLTAAAAILGVSVVLAKWNARQTAILPEPMVHEAEIARAAGKEMLGPNARVGGRLGVWYASGGAHWLNISQELLWRGLPPSLDVAGYASRLDALAETNHMSSATSNSRNATLSSWYADGTLQLSGFFFAEANSDLDYLLLGGKRPRAISGFALKHGQLYRFQEDATGNYEVVSLGCPQVHAVWIFRWRVPFSSALDLPLSNPAETQRVVVTALVPPDGPHSYGSIDPGCRLVQQVRGFLLLADREALVDKLRREDTPMRFYRHLDDVPGASRPLTP